MNIRINTSYTLDEFEERLSEKLRYTETHYPDIDELQSYTVAQELGVFLTLRIVDEVRAKGIHSLISRTSGVVVGLRDGFVQFTILGDKLDSFAVEALVHAIGVFFESECKNTYTVVDLSNKPLPNTRIRGVRLLPTGGISCKFHMVREFD